MVMKITTITSTYIRRSVSFVTFLITHVLRKPFSYSEGLETDPVTLPDCDLLGFRGIRPTVLIIVYIMWRNCSTH